MAYFHANQSILFVMERLPESLLSREKVWKAWKGFWKTKEIHYFDEQKK